MKAVIQSGGRGTRLRPYTSVLPKPLMPIGARPVLELLLQWLRRSGIEDIYITTGYLGHLIRSFCGNGEQWGINIVYTQETEPLGTVGALSLLRDKLDSTFLVLNGDILTDLNLNAFTTSHQEHGGPLTIATTARSTKLDFGVIDDVGDVVVQFREKPTLSNQVSMGIYCMEPEVLPFIPNGTPFGFDDLVLCMMQKKVPVHTFRHAGLWLDIGRVDDFHKAQEMGWDDQVPSHQAAAI
ncbi:NTP transferase domain-containing protein [Microvirga sp. 3-52]|jgi:mannose-1-phosphate guanylyltransferase|nr:NTP transferase domain-containing protein [Microvirga sp. 3-52]